MPVIFFNKQPDFADIVKNLPAREPRRLIVVSNNYKLLSFKFRRNKTRSAFSKYITKKLQIFKLRGYEYKYKKNVFHRYIFMFYKLRHISIVKNLFFCDYTYFLAMRANPEIDKIYIDIKYQEAYIKNIQETNASRIESTFLRFGVQGIS